MKVKKIVFVICGCICIGLGYIGILLPILPTVPFFLAALFFFANSSEHLHDWFLNTTMYKKHLESFVQKKAMKRSSKAMILTMVCIVMAIGFIMMKNLFVPLIILGIVWLAHVVYFVFGVKTLHEETIE